MIPEPRDGIAFPLQRHIGRTGRRKSHIVEPVDGSGGIAPQAGIEVTLVQHSQHEVGYPVRSPRRKTPAGDGTQIETHMVPRAIVAQTGNRIETHHVRTLVFRPGQVNETPFGRIVLEREIEIYPGSGANRHIHVQMGRTPQIQAANRQAHPDIAAAVQILQPQRPPRSVRSRHKAQLDALIAVPGPKFIQALLEIRVEARMGRQSEDRGRSRGGRRDRNTLPHRRRNGERSMLHHLAGPAIAHLDPGDDDAVVLRPQSQALTGQRIGIGNGKNRNIIERNIIPRTGLSHFDEIPRPMHRATAGIPLHRNGPRLRPPDASPRNQLDIRSSHDRAQTSKLRPFLLPHRVPGGNQNIVPREKILVPGVERDVDISHPGVVHAGGPLHHVALPHSHPGIVLDGVIAAEFEFAPEGRNPFAATVHMRPARIAGKAIRHFPVAHREPIHRSLIEQVVLDVAALHPDVQKIHGCGNPHAHRTPGQRILFPNGKKLLAVDGSPEHVSVTPQFQLTVAHRIGRLRQRPDLLVDNLLSGQNPLWRRSKRSPCQRMLSTGENDRTPLFCRIDLQFETVAVRRIHGIAPKKERQSILHGSPNAESTVKIPRMPEKTRK